MNQTVLSQAGEQCATDQDCATQLICFSNEFNWVTSNVSECGCNSWYGYTGDECTEIGAASTIFILSLVLTLGIGLLSMFISGKTLILVFSLSEKLPKMRRRSSTGLTEIITGPEETEISGRKKSGVVYSQRKKEKKSQFNAMNTTSIFAFLGILFYVMFRLSQLINFLTPTNIITRTEDNIEGPAKVHFLEEKVDSFLIILTGIFMSLSVMNLSLVWIDNVRKIQSFTIQNKQKILRYKYVLVTLNVAFSCIVIFSPVVYVSVAIIVLLILASVTYIVAVMQLRKLQKSLGGDNMGRGSFSAKNYWLEVLVKRMIVARRRIVLGTVMSVLGALFYTITSIENSWREYSPIGYPSAPMTGNELMIFGLGFIQFAVITFLFESAKKPVRTKSKTKKKRKTGKVEMLSE